MGKAKLEPDVSYSAGIRACKKGEQRQADPALLCEKLEAKLEPEVVRNRAGSSANEKGEQWQQSLSPLSEMWKARIEPRCHQL